VTRTLGMLALGLLLSTPQIASASSITLLDTIVDWSSVTQSTQTDRANRNSVRSTWGVPRPFPGTGATGDRSFTSFAINVGTNPFLFVEFTNLNDLGNVQVEAYQTSFTPTNIALNWLADAGESTGLPSNPNVNFDVQALLNSVVIITLNQTTAGPVPAGEMTRLRVTGYDSPTAFGSGPGPLVTTAVPEPTSLLLVGSALAGLGVRQRRRRRR
jgi:hypothetical protein